jgi:ABC-type bacteriocin/lantibiotic exporter with double-glycine peptidase domain
VRRNLLLLPHHKQRQQADCLAACVAMVLEYWKQPLAYTRLIALLGIQDFGAPSSNVRRLADLGLSVSFDQGDLASLEVHLQRGEPCIVFLRTGELPYWVEDTGHAVVVVGLDSDTVYFNDPAFDKAPQQVSHGDFLLAWLDFDYDYAVITP